MSIGRTKRKLETTSLSVIAEKGPLYGRELIGEIQHRTGGKLVLAASSLYPPLHRLEKRGWIESETGRSPSGSGAIFYYTATEVGRKTLEEQDATKTWVQTLGRFLKL